MSGNGRTPRLSLASLRDWQMRSLRFDLVDISSCFRRISVKQREDLRTLESGELSNYSSLSRRTSLFCCRHPLTKPTGRYLRNLRLVTCSRRTLTESYPIR